MDSHFSHTKTTETEYFSVCNRDGAVHARPISSYTFMVLARKEETCPCKSLSTGFTKRIERPMYMHQSHILGTDSNIAVGPLIGL